MTASATLIVTSYNILHPDYALRHRETAGIMQNAEGQIVSNWPQRQHHVAENLAASGTTIACVQEVSIDTLAPLCAQFRALSFYPTHFRAPPNSASAGNAILSRDENLVRNETLMLPGAEPQARTATAAFLTLLPTSQRLLVISLHIAGYPHAEPEAVKLAAAKQPGFNDLKCHLKFAEAQKRRVDCIIIAGDFNEDPAHDGRPLSRHDLMRAHGYRSDGNLAASEPAQDRKIDWIYVWSRTPVQMTPITTPPPHPGASDHLPVVTRVVLG